MLQLEIMRGGLVVSLLLFLTTSCHAVVVQFLNETDVLLHRTAAFGPQPGMYNVTGKLVIATPPFTGCTEWTQQQADIIKGNILVVIRGECAFVKKTLFAQKAGAVGLIVGNNVRTANVEQKYLTMGVDSSAIPNGDVFAFTIPSVFVPNEALGFLMLVASFEASQFSVFLDSRGEVNPYQMNESQQSVIEFANLLRMVMVLAAMFPMLWMCYLGSGVLKNIFVGCLNRCERHNRLMTIPTFVYSSVHSHRRDDPEYVVNNSCVICLDDFMEGQSVRRLPCQHAFCNNCIMTWLEDRSDQCPICKRSILDRTPEESSSLCLMCCNAVTRRIRVFMHRRTSSRRNAGFEPASQVDNLEYDLEAL